MDIIAKNLLKEDSKAYDTLQLHFTDITGSNLDPATLAGGLFAAKIIGKARVDEASNPVWPNHQTKRTNILSEVMNSGKPGAFREFVLLILKMDQCVWLGEKLIETYKRNGGVWVEIPPQQRVTSTQSMSATSISLTGSFTLPAPVLRDLIHLQVSDWYALGLALGLDPYDLDVTRKDNQGDTKQQTLRMFQLWLDRQPRASYEQLIQALRELQDERVVTVLCRKYGIVPPASAGAGSQLQESSPAAVHVPGGSQPQPSYMGGGAQSHPPNSGYAPMQQYPGPSQIPFGQVIGSTMLTQQPPYPQPNTGYPYPPGGSHGNVHPPQYTGAHMQGPSHQVNRMPTTATTLTPDDLGVLKRLLLPVAAHWVAIADQLRMGQLKSIIEGTYGNTNPPACLRDLLYRWLNQGQPTLETLCQALRDDPEITGGGGVATKLEEEFQRRRGYLPHDTTQSTTHQPLYPQQMHPGYQPNTSQYPPQQGHYYAGNYPPPTQLQPDGSSRHINMLPSQYTGLAGQAEVGHSYQDEYPGLRYAPEMKDLLNEIAVMLPEKWREIGRGLGLQEYELGKIQAECGWQQSTNNLFSAVFDKWYNASKSPYTWEQVVKVLYQPSVGGNRVADELRRKHWRS